MTIARFRRRHAEALIGLFSGVLAPCAEAGLVRVGLVAIDGTGIRANANKDRFVDESELAEQARRLLAEAEAEDAREDALAAEEQAGRRGLLPAGFTSEQDRRACLDAAAQRLAKGRQPAAAGSTKKLQRKSKLRDTRSLSLLRQAPPTPWPPDGP